MSHYARLVKAVLACAPGGSPFVLAVDTEIRMLEVYADESASGAALSHRFDACVGGIWRRYETADNLLAHTDRGQSGKPLFRGRPPKN